MIIRKAKMEDCAILDEMLTLLVEDEKQYNNGIKDGLIFKKVYDKYIDDNKKCVIVAEEDDDIVGYLYGYLCDDSTMKDNISFIDALYIKKDYRNKGTGTALIDSFKKWSINNKVNAVQICVLSENKNAKNLYNKLGFNPQKETLICKID